MDSHSKAWGGGVRPRPRANKPTMKNSAVGAVNYCEGETGYKVASSPDFLSQLEGAEMRDAQRSQRGDDPYVHA